MKGKEISEQLKKSKKDDYLKTDTEDYSIYQISDRTTYSTKKSFTYNRDNFSIPFLSKFLYNYYENNNKTFLSVITESVIEYSGVIDLIFNLTRDMDLFTHISNSNSRDVFFTVLDTVVSLITFDTRNVYFGVLLSECVNSFKKNIIYLDKINLEQKQREQEAKLLVRNLRHSINNTSEAVLANLKQAIEIINLQDKYNTKSTVNHLYSCSDEVRVLRNTVLKFCHEIIDTETLGELYRESFSEVKSDERISIREIIYSALFMSVKQIIQNIKLKDIKAYYRKAKEVESQYNDSLLNKFKDYIGIKYDQDFSELTEKQIKNDKTLLKDYLTYVYTAIQSADFERLYEEFVQENDFTAVIGFMEKFFFSKVEIILKEDDIYLRRSSYASYLFTDLLNEICLNAIKYALPDSAVQINFETSNNKLIAECKNSSNPNLQHKYGSGTGIIGQQKVIEKIGGSLQTRINQSGDFSIKFELPIY